MDAPRERHGESLYAVVEPEGETSIAFYDHEGLVPPNLVRYDLHSLTVGIRDRADTRFVPYRRYFGRIPDASAPPSALLERLGAAMDFSDSEDSVGDIPAGYTYLGQFVFHDLSSMKAGTSAATPRNVRSAALDLDSIFGALPTESGPRQSQAWPAPVTVGETTDGQLRDIPRTSEGIPVLADRRNDSNLPLAQMHMALMRFYNAVCQVSDGDAEGRRLTQLHFQSVVLHDYARRIIDPAVYEDVMEHGRAIIHTDDRAFLLPLEFAAACARFGHSMVRNTYPWNAMHPGANLHAFWDNTFISAVNPITRLRGHWAADWPRLVGVGLAAGEQPIFAAKINTRLAFPLKNIRPQALSDPPGSPLPFRNLAIRSLVRGHILKLSGAQDVFARMARQLRHLRRPEFDLLTEEELTEGETQQVRDVLTERPDGRGVRLIHCTPLWFYVLKEASAKSRGLKLGPLGSRIVMETLHAAISEAEPSILRSPDGQQWRPDERLRSASPANYTFADLIAFSGLA